MNSILSLAPRDPLLARDSRPLTAGGRMRSLDWFMPSVVAGSVRRLIGRQLGLNLEDSGVQQELLESVLVSSCFPVVDRHLLLPSPLDCILSENCRGLGNHVASARPGTLQEGEGTDLPDSGLNPAILNNTEDFKAKPSWEFWTQRSMVKWLCDDLGTSTRRDQLHPRYQTPVHDTRFHVRIDPATGTAEDGMLFSTDGLDLTTLPSDNGALKPFDLNSEVGLEVRIDFTPDSSLAAATASFAGSWHSLGGEGRLSWWEQSADKSRWECPQEIKTAFASDPKKIRMVLASPAIFPDNGWFPDWLDSQSLTGWIPGTSVFVKLSGACVNRWQPVSGWSYAVNKPKAIRRTVPAGSVYFFEVQGSSESEAPQSHVLTSQWLRSVCCNKEGAPTQDSRDGFGIALWGVWDSH